MSRNSGFALLDLMIVVAISGLLGVIAVPSYTAYVDRARATEAIADIYEIQLAIVRYEADSFSYPDSLDELGGVPRVDPWGSTYQFLRIDGNGMKGIKGKQRKDKKLNPLNSDFDLYSVGKDLASKLPLTSKDARDDIVRAGNGGFVGLAVDH